MSLSPEQSAALDQLWAITASTTDASRARDERLLRENGWNVESTVNQIFALPNDQPPSPGTLAAGPSRSNSSTFLGPALTTTTTPRAMEKMEIDDGGVELSPRQGVAGAGATPSRKRAAGSLAASGSPGGRSRGQGQGPGGIWGVLGWPFRVVLGVVGGAWYFFIRTFIPLSFIPHLPTFLLPPGYHYSPPSRLRAPDPTLATISFLQDLSLLHLSPHAQTCPDFYIGPYREFLNTLRKEGKVGMIVLCCGEHEDDEEFKRSVLGDAELIRMLREKDILVWGADVRTREGYQVAGTLLASTYPSLYFLSLLPPSASRTGGGGGSPKLQILTTLAGPPATTTSSAAIMQLITNSILPRTSAFLARLKRERLTLEEARHLREEQDRAFREAEKRDREKARLAKEKEDAAKVRAEREKREAEEEERQVEARKLWRRYARKHLLPPPTAPAQAQTQAQGSVRVAIRTPLNADRNVRHFALADSTEELYIYAETLLIPASHAPADDPDEAPAGFTPPEDFRLVTTFPRVTIERTSVGGKDVWETIKKHGGALIAEKLESSEWGEAERRAIRSQTGDDQESDEEVVE